MQNDIQPASSPPSLVGPHRIVSVLGEGGSAVVYLAEQRLPFRRTVALKLLKTKVQSADSALRFEQELQTLALLQHTNIVQVFDCAARGRERPYFTMEYVDGLSITEFCDHHDLTVAERLRLVLEVCDAVQYIHQNGIIHRDIKASNLLVQQTNGRRVAKLIDFGLAKLAPEHPEGEPTNGEDGGIFGTLGYMSPEQAAEERIDTRADVYSLGVLLYEILTGSLPIEPPQKAAEVPEYLRRLRQERPRFASESITTSTDPDALAAQRKTTAIGLQRALRGDLDWILRKALEKEPADRYATASALRRDIRAFLRGDPVSVGPPNAVYYIRQGIRRHRVVVLATLVTICLLTSAVALSAFWHLRLGAQHERELRFLRLAEAVQLNVANAHLWLEEGLAGDPGVDLVRDVHTPIEASSALLDAALRGGSTEIGTFEPVQIESLRGPLNDLEADMLAFAEISTERWDQREQGHAAGTALDRECDTLYQDILRQGTELSLAVSAERAAKQGKLSWSVLLVNVVTVLLTLTLVIAVARVWVRRRRRMIELGSA